MKFLYDIKAGQEQIKIENESFNHLKARRAKIGDTIELSNLNDGKIYLYEITEFSRKCAELKLVFASLNEQVKYDFSIAWAVIDPKTIEKTLPFLNELGVGKIIFVYTKFSQRNFKLDLAKFERICALSCEQCGRESMMKFEIYQSLDDFLNIYKNVALINFSKNTLENYSNELLFIGPEGGFSSNEVKQFTKSYGLGTKNILRSQTAITATTAKILC